MQLYLQEPYALCSGLSALHVMGACSIAYWSVQTNIFGSKIYAPLMWYCKHVGENEGWTVREGVKKIINFSTKK